MTITRSPAFYCQDSKSLYNFDWRDHLSVKDLRHQHKGWEFKELPHAYRFIDPKRNIAKYYKMDGNVVEIPCGHLSFSDI